MNQFVPTQTSNKQHCAHWPKKKKNPSPAPQRLIEKASGTHQQDCSTFEAIRPLALTSWSGLHLCRCSMATGTMWPGWWPGRIHNTVWHSSYATELMWYHCPRHTLCDKFQPHLPNDVGMRNWPWWWWWWWWWSSNVHGIPLLDSSIINKKKYHDASFWKDQRHTMGVALMLALNNYKKMKIKYSFSFV